MAYFDIKLYLFYGTKLFVVIYVNYLIYNVVVLNSGTATSFKLKGDTYARYNEMLKMKQ